jgi:hypothetical protein
MRHAIEIPAGALAALRDYAAVRQQEAVRADLDALCAGTGPLSPADRQVLQEALVWRERQLALAGERVREIRTRLDGR